MNILTLIRSSVAVYFTVEQVDFQLSCPDGQDESFQKHQYLLTFTS